ncbi:hypothetical protein [Nocardioides bruguierae]|nr:hypothetical protein [Nocardioides bruguierae]MCL8026035.1 hypothetical protein [Nocardioides bruguierae]
MSELERDADGRQVVRVVTEEAYFRWMFTGVAASAESYPARLVWVE